MAKAFLYLILLSSLLSIQYAYSTQSVDSLLSGYNVSNALMAQLTYANISYGGSSYVALYQGAKPLFLVNTTTSTYGFVLNQTSIATIMRATLVNQSLKSANFANLKTLMLKYQNSSAASYNDCAAETGATSGLTCTLSNYCQSCSFVPVCNKVLYQTGGPSGSFGLGVAQFSTDYSELNSSYKAYFSSIAKVNSTNVNTNLADLNAAFSQIQNITLALYQNPIFPPPQGENFNLCVTGGLGVTYNSPLSNAPWFCNSIGFCEFLTYNQTTLGQIAGYLTYVNALPLSNQGISGLAANISSNEGSYVYPILKTIASVALNKILNTTLADYSIIINNTLSLSTHVSNATMQKRLVVIESSYASLLKNYTSANLIAENRTLAVQLANLSAIYTNINATYGQLLKLSVNNTKRALMLEIGTQPSSQASALAFQEEQLNAQLTGKIVSVSSMKAALVALNQQLYGSGLPSNPIIWLSRAIDAPFATALGASAGSYDSAVALAPAYSAILSLVIGIIVIVAVFLYYNGLMKNQRIRVNRRTIANWKKLFIILTVLILIFVIATYMVASYASGPATAGAFIATYRSSNTLVIALNGTATPQISFCANETKAGAVSMHKHVTVVSFNGNACSGAGSAFSTVSQCMSQDASKNIPVIVLGSSANNTATIYSFYGTRFTYSGNGTYMNLCIPALFTR